MITQRSVCAILPAAGSGSRFGRETNKLFVPLLGRPLWTHAAKTIADCPWIGQIILAVSAGDREQFQREIDAANLIKPVTIVLGGEQRTDSVAAALKHCSGAPSDSLIAVHDAARPCLRIMDLNRVIETAHCTGAAILATPVTGTVKRKSASNESMTTRSTLDREGLFIALTPQVFRRDVFVAALRRHRGRPATDDAELVERSGHPVTLVLGASDNLKVTLPEDLAIAEAILQRSTDKTSPPG